jgi:hypothetical protein
MDCLFIEKDVHDVMIKKLFLNIISPLNGHKLIFFKLNSQYNHLIMKSIFI